MASSSSTENALQCKTCRCGDGDNNFWTTRLGDNSGKQTEKCPSCEVLKSGTLFISSKGLGWTSWKKRWFILTRKSLVFFRSDPAAAPQKEGEPNVSLGGIDLNNSGRVEVKADKKLLTVLFPDSGDVRAFTLKAETSEDLNEWKVALENALAQASSPAHAAGPNSVFGNDITESVEPPSEQVEEEAKPPKSTVIGQPVEVALEDSDGNPSFLEKALRFIEQYGIKVEGILRQSADVEEVERRVREYEQGKVEFSPDEDAHVIGDCIKHVLREMPNSPIPAAYCTVLVEAYRNSREHRIDAIRDAIYENFPEPNFHLLQRILKMMQIVASHKSQNRMSLSALAACMAPLLLRPLLAGDCQFDDDFTMGGDGSIQLLKAAAAANHAQAIVIILLEEYDNVFDEDFIDEEYSSSENYSETEVGDGEDYESTDNDIPEHDGYHDEHNENEADIDEDPDNLSSQSISDKSSKIACNPHQKASKNLPMKLTDLSSNDEVVIQKLESTVSDLQTKIAKEAKENVSLQSSLEKRKETLHERRLALEEDVKRLRQQLQKERDLRASLESGLMNMRPGQISYTSAVDSKTRSDLEDIARAEGDVIALKQKVADLRGQLDLHLQQGYATLCESCKKCLNPNGQSLEKVQREDVKHGSSLEHSKKDGQSGPSQTRVKNGQEILNPEKVKSGSHDISRLLNKQSSDGQQPHKRSFGSLKHHDSSRHSEHEKSEIEGDSRRVSNRTGEAISSAATLAKLSNRLMLLKERREQIMADIKNSENINSTSDLDGLKKKDPDGPPPRTKFR